MSEPTAVITGASDGIGAAAARRLHRLGLHVVVVGRSPDKTKRLAEEIDAPYYLADFSKLDEVRTLGAKLRTDLSRIDVLANNAGGVMGDRQLTVDGNELTIQVNHLAPFLLTQLLMDTLVASRASVIATSSLAHRGAGRLELDDMTLAKHYSPMRAYAKAKLMNILFTTELHRRYHDNGVQAAAFHPGIVRTSFSAEFGGYFSVVYTSVANRLLRSPDQGADTLVWLATESPEQDWLPGRYYKDRQVTHPSPQANDAVLAHDLWEVSSHLTAVQ